MPAVVNLYSEDKKEIVNFLKHFYGDNFVFDMKETDLRWEKNFDNPIELAEIIGVFIDNKDSFKINMWISIDKDTFINVSDSNVDDLIKYLYERFPY